MLIREITVEDIPGLVELGRAMYAESPVYRHMPFEDAVARGWFFRALEQPESVFCRMTEIDGKLTGAMVAFCGPMMFSSVKMASDLGMYVFPEYRGTRAAYLLLKEFEEWLVAQECKRAILGVTAGIDNEGALSFYKKMGFKRMIV